MLLGLQICQGIAIEIHFTPITVYLTISDRKTRKLRTTDYRKLLLLIEDYYFCEWHLFEKYARLSIFKRHRTRHPWLDDCSKYTRIASARTHRCASNCECVPEACVCVCVNISCMLALRKNTTLLLPRTNRKIWNERSELHFKYWTFEIEHLSLMDSPVDQTSQ